MTGQGPVITCSSCSYSIVGTFQHSFCRVGVRQQTSREEFGIGAHLPKPPLFWWCLCTMTLAKATFHCELERPVEMVGSVFVPSFLPFSLVLAKSSFSVAYILGWSETPASAF